MTLEVPLSSRPGPPAVRRTRHRKWACPLACRWCGTSCHPFPGKPTVQEPVKCQMHALLSSTSSESLESRSSEPCSRWPLLPITALCSLSISHTGGTHGSRSHLHPIDTRCHLLVLAEMDPRWASDLPQLRMTLCEPHRGHSLCVRMTQTQGFPVTDEQNIQKRAPSGNHSGGLGILEKAWLS